MKTMKTQSDDQGVKDERESVKAGANCGAELGDHDLEQVSGGITCRKAGKDQQEYLTFDGRSIISI